VSGAFLNPAILAVAIPREVIWSYLDGGIVFAIGVLAIFVRGEWRTARGVYAVAGILLLIGKKTRAAVASIGLTVVLVILAVYVPIAIVQRADMEGLNYLFDTLMYGGTVLLLARAMPRANEQPSALSASASKGARQSAHSIVESSPAQSAGKD